MHFLGHGYLPDYLITALTKSSWLLNKTQECPLQSGLEVMVGAQQLALISHQSRRKPLSQNTWARRGPRLACGCLFFMASSHLDTEQIIPLCSVNLARSFYSDLSTQQVPLPLGMG